MLTDTDDLKVIIPLRTIRYASETEEGVEYQIVNHDGDEFDIKGDINELFKAMQEEL